MDSPSDRSRPPSFRTSVPDESPDYPRGSATPGLADSSEGVGRLSAPRSEPDLRTDPIVQTEGSDRVAAPTETPKARSSSSSEGDRQHGRRSSIRSEPVRGTKARTSGAAVKKKKTRTATTKSRRAPSQKRSRLTQRPRAYWRDLSIRASASAHIIRFFLSSE